ncbi:MAG: hypothetical protein HY722_16135 [Planctomycetes bacterium]|nr:hypothetical protein [Planctomycetota bacterium]
MIEPRMADTPIFVPLGSNLSRHWKSTGRGGEGTVFLVPDTRRPILVRWEEYAFEKEGFVPQAPQVLGRFFLDGAPFRPTREVHRTSRTGNLGTTRQEFESLAPEGLCCTEWFTPEGAVRAEKLRLTRDHGLWMVEHSAMVSGAVHNTVVYVHVHGRFFFDLPRMEVASLRESHVDDST